MKITNLSWIAVGLIALSSCSKDKKSDEIIPRPDGPQGVGQMEVLTPEQSKQYLQQTATEFLDCFRPQDQQAAIKLASYFMDEYGDLDLPEDFDFEATPRSYFRAIRQAASGNVNALTRTAYSYNINFDRIKGVYEPSVSRGEWVRTGNSDAIIFKFTNRQGQPVELKVTQGGGTSDFDFKTIDQYQQWYWNPDKEDYDHQTITDTYTYYLSIPKTVEATLTENGVQLASSRIVSSINVNAHTAQADITATLCNLNVKATLNGVDTRVEASTLLSINGQAVASAYAKVTGNQLCNIDKWEAIVNDEDDADDIIASMVSNADCGMNVMGKVQCYGQAAYYKGMADDLDFYCSNSRVDSMAEGQRLCQEACNRLNAHITTQLRYNLTATDQGTLRFVPQPWVSEYNPNYWDYTIEQHILFPDGTSYSVDSYFDSFTNVSNKWDALLDAYEKVWDSARTRR